jgi:hypothetical protein
MFHRLTEHLLAFFWGGRTNFPKLLLVDGHRDGTDQNAQYHVVIFPLAAFPTRAVQKQTRETEPT